MSLECVAVCTLARSTVPLSNTSIISLAWYFDTSTCRLGNLIKILKFALVAVRIRLNEKWETDRQLVRLTVVWCCVEEQPEEKKLQSWIWDSDSSVRRWSRKRPSLWARVASVRMSWGEWLTDWLRSDTESITLMDVRRDNCNYLLSPITTGIDVYIRRIRIIRPTDWLTDEWADCLV